ncbi:MAG: hypothetical protein NXI17_05640 [Alphaproteobacteria bacterium]|nr:hypothetical protein [Alphaproteobacteria bacterium]
MIPSQKHQVNCTYTSRAIRSTNPVTRLLQVSLAITALSVFAGPEAFASDQTSPEWGLQNANGRAYDSQLIQAAVHKDATVMSELLILAQANGGQRPPGGGQGPDLSQAAAQLGVSVDALRDALGGPPPNFAQAAEKLGISEEQLQSVMPRPPRQ